MSGFIDKAKAKVEAVLHKDNTSTSHTGTGSTHTGTGAHNTTGNTYGSDPTGPHDSRLGNKADPRVDSDRVGGAGNTASAGGATHTGFDSGTHAGTHTGAHTGTTGSGTYGSDPTGPHDSRLGNKADPRVDSDRVGGAGNTASAGGASHTGFGSSGTTTDYNNDPSGPHKSHLANKLDPRVDSNQAGGYGNTRSTGGATHTGYDGSNTSSGTGYGNTSTTGSGYTGSSGPGPASNTAGPHKSDLLNKADPRVDSDLDGSKTYGGNQTHAGAEYGSTGTGHSTTGTGYGSSTTGTGYGSSTTGTGYTGSSGPGPATNTAGPHGSNALNKADPRVDSDLDGSKTYGGNQTYGGNSSSGY